MERAINMNELIVRSIKDLTNKEKKEVLDFIEFLRIKEDRSFIEYVNRRTQESLRNKKQGKVFASLGELRKEYA